EGALFSRWSLQLLAGASSHDRWEHGSNEAPCPRRWMRSRRSFSRGAEDRSVLDGRIPSIFVVRIEIRYVDHVALGGFRPRGLARAGMELRREGSFRERGRPALRDRRGRGFRSSGRLARGRRGDGFWLRLDEGWEQGPARGRRDLGLQTRDVGGN